ncbi:heavy metal-associated isoprenylated plant protein 46-like [Aristolochia californica]|uniref:heavy metal-associated isoprenylated plant protein 46-like n=1 Tax=Aristolochia californica TaxID=171875 RepID=UPI0035D5E059
MKQKTVLKLQMNNPKTRSKAMKVVVGVPGVLSAAIEGEEKNKIVVIGEGVDSINLTRLLRKTMGFAELVSVTPMDQKKKQDDDYKSHDVTKTVKPIAWANQASVPPYVYQYQEPNHDPCSIL